jgi:molecular chaperone HtpG
MLSDEKFYERAEKFALFKDIDNKYFTFEEYKSLIKDNQKDKNGTLVYLYSTNPNDQYGYIQSAKDKGYNVLLLDGQLDIPLIGQLEHKFEKTMFVRVDSDTTENLIHKDEAREISITEEQRNALQEVFKSKIPKLEKADFIVTFESLGKEANPVMITQSEYMRRMREMAAIQPGMSFYGEMPDNYNLVLNTEHKLIKKALADEENACNAKVKPVLDEIKGWEARQRDLREIQNKKKSEEITESEKQDLTDTNKKLDELREQRNNIYKDFAKDNNLVSQLIDLALLSNGMLKGESLSKFVKRSAEMIG